ncbi:MAG TPA: ATP-binding protein [Actinomycetota bacterium]|nr:ATP-binding protein [Actinomycetota bacterium]
MKELFGASVSVAVPARPDFVSVLRSVTAGVAARLDYSFDGIDDLRIAVDEACAQLLAAAPHAGELRLRLTPDEGGLEVVASISADGVQWPPPNVEASLAWQILAALADETAFETVDGSPALRLRKDLPNGDGR